MTLQKGAFDLSWVKTSEGGVNYDDKKYLSSAFKIRMNFTTISLKCLPQKLSILPSLIDQANLKLRQL